MRLHCGAFMCLFPGSINPSEYSIHTLLITLKKETKWMDADSKEGLEHFKIAFIKIF